jgi:cytidylate kinase
MSIRVVTIARGYGSGGGEVARLLAAKLGWHLFDRQVVSSVALKLGISEDEAFAHDEHADSFVQRIIESMQFSGPIYAPVILSETDNPIGVNAKQYHDALQGCLLAVTDIGNVVIVGRGAQMLLASRRDVLRIYITAPLEQRIEYVKRRENLDAAAAQARIEQKDHDRIRDIKEQYHRNPDDAQIYDLTINTSVLDLQSAVDLICLALERKEQRLNTSEEELGPYHGLSLYPGLSDNSAQD